MIDYDELDAKMDAAPGGAALHDEAPDNEVFHWGLGKRDETEAALAGAAHRVVTRVEDNRVIVNSMEPRGCFAEGDGSRLHLAYGGQGVWGTKANLATAFGLSPEDVRVTNPDVGGGFGMKAMDYPELFRCRRRREKPRTTGPLDVHPHRGDAVGQCGPRSGLHDRAGL